MKTMSRATATMTLLALVVTPLLSCFVPAQLLSAEDHSCCAAMGSQCGSEKMSSPQSCCTSDSDSTQAYAVSGPQSQYRAALPVLAVLAADVEVTPSILFFIATGFESHSPPLSPPETFSILRT